MMQGSNAAARQAFQDLLTRYPKTDLAPDAEFYIAETYAAENNTASADSAYARVATKYPNIARRHFAGRGVQAEVVHLNGAMELAPGLGLSRLIVDLVQTGGTLRANGLQETEVIAEVSSRLIVNRTALKTRAETVGALVARFRAALG